jgi:hypothetical protein
MVYVAALFFLDGLFAHVKGNLIVSFNVMKRKSPPRMFALVGGIGRGISLVWSCLFTSTRPPSA